MNSPLTRFAVVALLIVTLTSCSSDGAGNEQLQQRVSELEARLAQAETSQSRASAGAALEETPPPASPIPPTSDATATGLTTAQTRFIANTGGIGVGIRDDCQQTARIGSAWREGTEVRLLAIGEGRCAGWQLTVSDGQESWVRSGFLTDARPAATSTLRSTPSPSAPTAATTPIASPTLANDSVPTATATPIATPVLGVSLTVTAFCNAGLDTSDSCRTSAANGLLASAGWSLWATAQDYGNVLYHLDGGPGLNKTGFSSSFASLAPGNHWLTLQETVSGRTMGSQPWIFAVVAPPAPVATPDPFAADCALFTQGYLEAKALNNVAGIYMNWLREQIDFYCR